MPSAPIDGAARGGRRFGIVNLGVRMLAGFVAGALAGALVAHSLYGLIFLGIVLGPVAGVQLARRVDPGGLPLVLAYAIGLGLGLLFLGDGRTVTPGNWRLALSITVFTAVAGGVASLLAHSPPD